MILYEEKIFTRKLKIEFGNFLITSKINQLNTTKLLTGEYSIYVEIKRKYSLKITFR